MQIFLAGAGYSGSTMRIEAASLASYARVPQRAASAPPAAPQDQVTLSSRLAATAREAASLERKLECYVPGQVLVKLKAGTSIREIRDFATDFNATVLRRYEFPGSMAKAFDGELVQLQLPDGMTTAQAVAAMGADTRAAYAEPNYRIHLDAPDKPPTDLTDDQWNLRNRLGVDIKALDAWKITTGQRENGPVVAILDTGIDYDHADLQPNMWINPSPDPNDPTDGRYGTNLVSHDADPRDDHNHGSHCAGIIGAAANNGGIVGINWNTNLMAVKLFDSEGGGDIANAVAAVAYATEKGARITNNSWGTDQFSQALKDVLAASPALHVCAAGNDGWDNDNHPSYPANYDLDNIVSVASHNNRNQLAPTSNRGAHSVDLAAPGVNITSTYKDGKYGLMSGTSMATPHVSGVAALIASKYPGADNETIKTRLMHSVDSMPSIYAEQLISGGRLNAARALAADDVAPGAPRDLAAQAVDGSHVRLRWTATGDDGTEGRAAAYEVRYSSVPISADDGEIKPGEVAFKDALPALVEQPQTSGTPETALLQVRPSGKEQTVYCALRVVDKVGNHSATTLTQVSVPASTLAFEEPKDGPSRLTPEGAWGQTIVAGRGSVWTDSPAGGYQPNRDDSLTSESISLKDWTEPVLQFDARLNSERKYDSCEVEVYGHKWWGGTKWRRLETLNGISPWQGHKISLSDYQGQDIKVRFRFHSDDSRNFDGVYLDNIVVTGQRQSDAPSSTIR